MREVIPPVALKAADKVRRIYWKAAKPERFGVKAFITHPEDREQILLIRQSYGNTQRLTMPGGGFKPKKETPESAARREVKEELGVELGDQLSVLCTKENQAEGKTDFVTTLGGVALSEKFYPNNEIAEAMWLPIHNVETDKSLIISGFVYDAIHAYRQQ